MSKEVPEKTNSAQRNIVVIGGAREVLDEGLKDFIVEWLVPALVEEYLRLHRKLPTRGEGQGQDAEFGSHEPDLNGRA